MNVVAIDLTKFTSADTNKVENLQKKVRLMRRWCRWERGMRDDREYIALYSGDRGLQPYANYRLHRDKLGLYVLEDGRSGTVLARARTIDQAISRIPDDFYHSTY